MATSEVDIDENALYGMFDQVLIGLESLANEVAETARHKAPGYGKKSRAKDVSLDFRKVKNLPVGQHDYVRPQIQDSTGEYRSVDYQPDVERFVLGELKKRESGLYEVYGSIPSKKRGKTVDYPVHYARAIMKATGRKIETREAIGDIVTHEREMVPVKLVTGKHLWESINVEVHSTGEASWEAVISADRSYAWYVEKGLGPGQEKRTPAYFMEGALAAHAADIESGNILKR